MHIHMKLAFPLCNVSSTGCVWFLMEEQKKQNKTKQKQNKNKKQKKKQKNTHIIIVSTVV